MLKQIIYKRLFFSFIYLIFFHKTLIAQNNDTDIQNSSIPTDYFVDFASLEPNDKIPANKASILVIGGDPSSIEQLGSTLVLKIKRIKGQKLNRKINREITKTGLHVWNGQTLWSYKSKTNNFESSELKMTDLSLLIEKLDPELEGNFEVAIADDPIGIGWTPEELIEILFKLNMQVTPGSLEVGFYIHGKGACSQLVALMGIRNLQALFGNIKLRFLQGRETSHIHIQDGDGRLKIASMALSHKVSLRYVNVPRQEVLQDSNEEIKNPNSSNLDTPTKVKSSNEDEPLFNEQDFSYADAVDYKYLNNLVEPDQAVGAHIKIFLDNGKYGGKVLRIDQRVPSFSEFNLDIKYALSGKKRPTNISPLSMDSNYDSLSYKSRIYSRPFPDGIPDASLLFKFQDHLTAQPFELKLNQFENTRNYVYFYEVIQFDEEQNKMLLSKLNNKIINELLHARMIQLTSYQALIPVYKPEELELSDPKLPEVQRYTRILQKISMKPTSDKPSNSGSENFKITRLFLPKNRCANSFSQGNVEALKSRLNPPASIAEHLRQTENMQKLFEKKSRNRLDNITAKLANFFKK